MTFEVRACRRRGYRAELSSHLPNRVGYAPAIGDARTLRNLPQFRISGRDSLEVKVESGKSAQTEIVAPTLPLNSFPDVQFLIVVLFKETDLYEHLTKIFAGVRGVKVIMEASARRPPTAAAGCGRRAARAGTAPAPWKSVCPGLYRGPSPAVMTDAV